MSSKQSKVSLSTAANRRLNNHRSIRDDQGAGVPQWTPAGIWILVWNRSRSHCFRFEPQQEESKLRSVQEPIKIFKGPIKISVMMLVVVKQNRIH